MLTHVDTGQCRQECAVKEADTLSKDDTFGHTFQVCDGDFDRESHLFVVDIPDEVTMTLSCPMCNPSQDSPLAPPPAAIADGSSRHAPRVVPG